MGSRWSVPSSEPGHLVARRPKSGPVFSTSRASIPSVHCSSRRGDDGSNCVPSRIGATCPVSKSLTFYSTCFGRCLALSYWSGTRRPFINARKSKGFWLNILVFMCTTFRPVRQNLIRLSLSGRRWKNILPVVRLETSNNFAFSYGLPFTELGRHALDCGRVSTLQTCHGNAK